MIKFNKPYIAGKELEYIRQALSDRNIAGNGNFSKLCQEVFRKKFNNSSNLITTSCTDALEMSAILSGINPGDEVILPTYTFVSTANAFILRGAKLVFIDSRRDHPGINENEIEKNITSKTKAIVPVHYAGVACDMNIIMNLAEKYKLIVIEDAAQSIDSYFNKMPLGSIGHLSCFSFHETKNIHCGEGGMLCINDPSLSERAEIIWEKGTNRSAFWRGTVNKYNWVDIGSSFLPSELNSAFLFSQLENLDFIQGKRRKIWELYFQNLNHLSLIGVDLPCIPEYASNNAHMFYLICRNEKERDGLILHLKKNDITSVFHYMPLHKSPFFKKKYSGEPLLYAQKYETRLLRLPLWVEMTMEQVHFITSEIDCFYKKQ